MRSLGWRVAPDSAELAHRSLRAAGVLRSEADVVRSEQFVVFPVRSPPDPPPEVGELVEEEFPERAAPEQNYRDLLSLPPAEAAELPRSFDIVGDVVVVRIPPALVHRSEEIGGALLRFVPGARVVARDEGVHGPERRRTLVRVAGSGEFRTVHRENGLSLEVDLGRAYFSPRLAREHARVAAAVRPNETVFDLCCGVGPFALTIARDGRARRVLAVDSNPAAIELLEASADRAGLGGRIEAVARPIEELLPTAGVADRVVLNLPHEGIKYASQVGTTVAPGGTLHYYEVTERSDRPGRPDALARAFGPSARFGVVQERVVHAYSPTSDLVAYDLLRSE